MMLNKRFSMIKYNILHINGEDTFIDCNKYNLLKFCNDLRLNDGFTMKHNYFKHINDLLIQKLVLTGFSSFWSNHKLTMNNLSHITIKNSAISKPML
jgi:nucleoside-specific outer membrane channel protein Tsx